MKRASLLRAVAYTHLDGYKRQVGDNLIHGAIYYDSEVRHQGYEFDELYEEIKPYVQAADVAYINQETILGGTELGLSHYPMFNSPQEIGTALVNTCLLYTSHREGGIWFKPNEGRFQCVSDGTLAELKASDIVRKICSKDKIIEMIDRVGFITVIQAPNEKVRKEFYQQAMDKYDELEWIRVIKTAYLHGQDQRLQPDVYKRQVDMYTLAVSNGKTLSTIIYPGEILIIPQQ